MKRRRGIALVLVLMVSFIILGVVLAGLEMGSRGALFVASTQQRNVALSAAEAGVYAGMAMLEQKPDFSGNFHGTLGNGSTWSVDVSPLTAERVKLLSTGRNGHWRKTLEVTLKLSADAYPAVSSQGQINVQQVGFVNAIKGIENPLPDQGNIHSNSRLPNAINVVGSPNIATAALNGVLSVTGNATAAGNVSGNVDGKHADDIVQSNPQLDMAQLMSGDFQQIDELPADGQINGRFNISGNTHFTQPLVLNDNSVVHIKGDVVLEGGISGKGTLVVDGNAVIKAGMDVDLQNTKGLMVYAGGDLTITHPNATSDGEGHYVSTLDPVGQFWATMPPTASYEMSQRLPPDAPTSVQFFSWYDEQSRTPSASFKAWRDGDHTSANPGLTQSTKDWLNNSRYLVNDLTTWGQK